MKGGEIYNQFPSSLLEGNLYDVGRGRLIPKYPWDECDVAHCGVDGSGYAGPQHSLPQLAEFQFLHAPLNKRALFNLSRRCCLRSVHVELTAVGSCM